MLVKSAFVLAALIGVQVAFPSSVTAAPSKPTHHNRARARIIKHHPKKFDPKLHNPTNTATLYYGNGTFTIEGTLTTIDVTRSRPSPMPPTSPTPSFSRLSASTTTSPSKTPTERRARPTKPGPASNATPPRNSPGALRTAMALRPAWSGFDTLAFPVSVSAIRSAPDSPQLATTKATTSSFVSGARLRTNNVGVGLALSWPAKIGARFWDMVLQEHAKYKKDGIYDDAIATFFRNSDGSVRNASEILSSVNGRQKLMGLKARGIMVDMEEGVINQIRNSPLSQLFGEQQHITSVSGSGNNWAVGHHQYGPEYREQIVEAIRREAEQCDSLQSFFLISSLGGGTGSGLGSYISCLLREEYPEVYSFATCVCPSKDDDVVTSPYNSVLSLSKLIDSADCILPVENQALLDIYHNIATRSPQKKKSGSALIDDGPGIFANTFPKRNEAFDTMNNIVANMLMNLTSSMRFEGSMNVDINDIITNLIPFPRLKLLLPSITPLYSLADVRMPARRLDQMFADAFSRQSQLVRADPKSSTYLACALIIRGDVEISDVRRNIEKIRSTLRFTSWNQEAWKTGICSVPPIGQPHCLLALANNCCIRSTMTDMRDRFVKLYSRKANVHHYTQHMELAEFGSSLRNVERVIAEYGEQEWK
ncbi:Tubulin epsilon chain [Rhizophlyctis rosea]|uniref:Tubulin epsilon chain n=1 Tax=Rhizophlyctis rosea TaxID=64517 RepID=A0AAD5S871_9FUNG|nr:Tubulin epsilon chain [Rhizophlyctis rosea]